MKDENNNGEAGLPEETGAVDDSRTLDTPEEANTDQPAPADQDGGSSPSEEGAGADDGKSEDPIDKMTPEEMRAELKKRRAISSRLEKKGQQPSTDFLTVGDFEKANEKNAITGITTIDKDDPEELQAIKKEIDENWERVRLFYTNRRGKKTVKDIQEDILDAHAVWKRREGEGKSQKADPASDLRTITQARPGQAPLQSESKPAKDDARFKKPGTPDTWYPKKKEA